MRLVPISTWRPQRSMRAPARGPVTAEIASEPEEHRHGGLAEPTPCAMGPISRAGR